MTKIAWADVVWNPWAGCRAVSPGCLNCYAEQAAAGPWLQRHPQYREVIEEGKWNGEVCRAPDRIMNQPLHWRKSWKVFVCSMSDFFVAGKRLHVEAFTIMSQAKQHTYMILTKRPAMAGRYAAYPEWVWLGTSCESQKWYNRRIKHLQNVDCKVRFLSIEPMLERINLHTLNGISWVIIGAESGLKRRPFKVEWLKSVVAQCDKAKVPVFVKQDSDRYPGRQGRIPDKLWQRKEFPDTSPRPPV